MGFDYDYVVIGSGFGGAVSALRLSEKGWRVAVLEMGKRWRPEDFATRNWNLRKFLWAPRLGLHGIQDITFLRDVIVFHGAGVGGGSLVYANTLLRPPDAAFRDPRWPGPDWRERLAPHYDVAERMLGASLAPELFAADELLRDIVGEWGRGETFRRHPLGVFFGPPGRTVPDPYFGGEGPPRAGCTRCGGCMTGCRHHAKNTLDRNYLHLAERRGAEIHPETVVTDVKALPGGGYEVRTRRSTAFPGFIPRGRRVYRARGVVLAAGVLGTVRLLLGCRARGSLPGLSPQLGNWVRTNSEVLVGAVARGVEPDHSRGLAITSGADPDPDTHVQIARYGRGQDALALLVTALVGGGPPWPRWLRWLGTLLRHPIATLRMTSPVDWARRTAILLVMQPVSSHLRLRLTWRPWHGFGRGRALTSAVEGGVPPPTYLPVANRLAEALAVKMDGRPGSVLPEVLGGTSTTAHVLGGATLARNPAEGVCDERGRVFGQEELYVADGSLVPANLGVNPSLTITALAEHVMSHVPANLAAPPRPAPLPGRLVPVPEEAA